MMLGMEGFLISERLRGCVVDERVVMREVVSWDCGEESHCVWRVDRRSDAEERSVAKSMLTCSRRNSAGLM